MEQENERVLYNIQNGARMVSILLFADARMALRLYQMFSRLHDQKLLKHGEMLEFEKFVKITKGNFDLTNVPGNISLFLHDLKQAQIRYCTMPDLNKSDGMIQVAVFSEDRQKFQALFEQHINRELQGGQKGVKELSHLTENHVSYISIPCEGAEQAIMEDLNALKVNYAMLPDLYVGDGDIQLMVANADLNKVEQWFEQYKEKIANVDPNRYQVLSKEEYLRKAELTEEQYFQTSDEKTKNILEQYDRKKPTVEFQEAISPRIAPEESPEFLKLKQDPDYEMVWIDKKAMVDENPVAKDMMRRYPEQFVSRIPGTWGKKEELLVLPSENVFLTNSGKTYLAFFKKEEKPLVLNASGKVVPISIRRSGTELKQHYSKVADSLQKSSKLALSKEAAMKTGRLEKFPANPMKAK